MELPQLTEQFYWWTAAIWNGQDPFGGESYGDRAPDGDPVSYPEGSGDVGTNYYSLPDAIAPLGLGSFDTPSDVSRIADLFESMPDEIVGFERSYPFGGTPNPGEYHALYGVDEDATGRPTFAVHLVANDLVGPNSDFSKGRLAGPPLRTSPQAMTMTLIRPDATAIWVGCDGTGPMKHPGKNSDLPGLRRMVAGVSRQWPNRRNTSIRSWRHSWKRL